MGHSHVECPGKKNAVIIVLNVSQNIRSYQSSLVGVVGSDRFSTGKSIVRRGPHYTPGFTLLFRFIIGSAQSFKSLLEIHSISQIETTFLHLCVVWS